jgi:hypothetical protein
MDLAQQLALFVVCPALADTWLLSFHKNSITQARPMIDTGALLGTEDGLLIPPNAV